MYRSACCAHGQALWLSFLILLLCIFSVYCGSKNASIPQETQEFITLIFSFPAQQATTGEQSPTWAKPSFRVRLAFIASSITLSGYTSLTLSLAGAVVHVTKQDTGVDDPDSYQIDQVKLEPVLPPENIEAKDSNLLRKTIEWGFGPLKVIYWSTNVPFLHNIPVSVTASVPNDQ